MSIINNGLLLASGADAAVGYQISRSLRCNPGDSANLSRTPGSAGNRKTFTWSAWVKRSGLAAYQRLFNARNPGVAADYIRFNNDDTLEIYIGATLITSQVFRDPSSWYHFVIAVDTTQATSTNRVKLYVNGTQVTTFGTANYPSQNADSVFNAALIHNLATGDGTSEYFSGYLADIYFLDGTATTPSTFAETDAVTGQWVPKTPTGISYGTNGFRLTFSDNSGTTSTTLGKDAAGSNNWSPNNFSVASGSGNDSLVDTPTSFGSDTGVGGEVRGNYATWNPLALVYNTPSLSNGNLDSANNNSVCVSTIGIPPTGKWYCEVSGTGMTGGICPIPRTTQIEYNIGNGVTGVIGIAVNRDADEVKLYKDNVLQSTTSISGAGISTSTTVFIQSYAGGTLNAGQRAFAYTAPSGFKALCDTNLTSPTIAKPNTVMDVVLYSGTGSNQTITGLNFNPDFVWLKRRSSAQAHYLYDVIRGTSSVLYSDGTDAEQSISTGLTAFNSNGFSLGSLSGVNASSTTNVAWAWDAGTSNTTNNSGSITGVTNRVNASAGFSIVTYTGTGANATIGHGGLANLSNGMIIIKNRSSATNWRVYHSALGNTKVIFLSTTGTPDTNSVYWNNTSPTSTVFSVGSDDGVNGNGNAMVAYCFAPVAGYSSFGSYTGNGSSQFVYLGFRPKFWMHKRTDSTGSWMMVDAVRSSYNVAQDQLYANLSNADSQYGGSGILDFVSNGVVLRSTGTDVNGSSVPYIYIAFAENPFAYARAR